MSYYDRQDSHTPPPRARQPYDSHELVTRQPQAQPYSQPYQPQYAPPQYTQPQPYTQPYMQPQMQPSPQMPHQPPQNTQMQNSVSNNTVVMLNTPSPTVNQPRPWSTGICDCFSDVSVCLCTVCCYQTQQYQIATDMGESCCVPCIVPGGMIVLRTKMRAQENIQGSIMDDCCTIWMCPPCAQCQLAREIKHVRRQKC